MSQKIKNALISLSDKSGIEKILKVLKKLEIILIAALPAAAIAALTTGIFACSKEKRQLRKLKKASSLLFSFTASTVRLTLCVEITCSHIHLPLARSRGLQLHS